MKKLRILVLLIILTFSFSVKAEVLLEIDCKSNEITSDKSVSCEGWLYYETEGVNDIEISYNTNLDINFNSLSGFTMTNSGNKLLIHSKETLFDELGFSTKIMDFTLLINDKCSEEEKVSFNNIKINNSNNTLVSGVTKTFNVVIPKIEVTPSPTPEIKLSSVCTLESIEIEKKKLSSFDKNTFEYKGINVTNEVIFIDAVRTDTKSSLSGVGDVLVRNGESIEKDVVILAEDGTKCVYKLYITNTTPKVTPTPQVLPNEEEKSNDNTLKTLEVYSNNKKINFNFDSKIDKYDLIVDNTNKVTIKATLNNDKATFDNILKPRDVILDLENNEILIKVKAENGEEKTYTLNIHVNKKKSHDNLLASLTINDKVIEYPDEEFEITLPNDVTKTIIKATASNEKATISFEDIDLEEGNNELKITVTAEDGTVREYNITVIREQEFEEEKEEIKEEKNETEENNKEESSNIIYFVVIGIVIIIVAVVVFIVIKKKKSKNNVNIEEI